MREAVMLHSSMLYRFVSSSSRFPCSDLLMNQGGRKVSLTKGIETRVTSNEHEYSLICFPIYSLQSALPCKQFGVRIAVNDFFETLNLPRSLSMRNRTKMHYFRLWKMFYFIHCNRRSLQFLTHRNVNSFISHRTWWLVWLRRELYLRWKVKF